MQHNRDAGSAYVNTFRHEENISHIHLKCLFLYSKLPHFDSNFTEILFLVSTIYNMPSLVHVMTCLGTCDKPLAEPMLTRSDMMSLGHNALTHKVEVLSKPHVFLTYILIKMRHTRIWG